MISDSRSHSGSSLHPTFSVLGQIQYLPQALVWFTEVVYRPHQVRRLLEGCQLSCQRPSTPYQCRDTGAKRAVESLYIRHMRLHSILRPFQQQSDLLRSANSDAMGNPYNTLSGNLFDHLNNTDMLPNPKMRTSPLACEDRSPEHLLDRRDIRRETINAEQQPTIQSATTHLIYQMCYQLSIAMGTHHATQPKASGYLKRHAQPGNSTLMLDAYFISLYLTQVTGLLNQMLMNLLAMIATTALPGCYRPLIQAKGCHYGWDGTAVCQESYYLYHKIRWITKTIEHCTFAFCERLAANMTYISVLFAAVNANVTTIHFSSCRTVRIVAEYLTGIHKMTPFSFLCV